MSDETIADDDELSLDELALTKTKLRPMRGGSGAILEPPRDDGISLEDPTDVADVALAINPGEGWLVLRVALPRLARRLEHARAWLDRYTPERFFEAAAELNRLGGAEGLALLAAVPPDRREAAIDRIQMDDADRLGLHALADRLGDPEDDRSPAAGLVRMMPSVARAALEVPGGDRRGVAALLDQAQRAYLQGELRSARESAKRGLDCLRAGGVSAERMLEGEALGLLGLAHAALGEPRRAIDFYEQRLAIARELGDRRGEGSALGNLGIAYAALGQAERAIDLHEQRLAIAQEIGDRRGEGNALGNLGNAYADLGEPRRAIELYGQHLAIARELGDRRGEGSALGNLGNAYADLGEPHRAIELYQQRLAIVRAIGDRRGEGNALGNLGNAYAALGQSEPAIDFYEQRLVIAREIGDRQGEAHACWNMGFVLVKLGRIAEAFPLMEVCTAYLREIGHPEAEKRAAAVETWRSRLAEKGQG